MVATPRSLIKRSKPIAVFAVTLCLFVTLLAVILNKQALVTHFQTGQTITARFTSAYKLVSTHTLAPASKVKIAGTPVGRVTGIKGSENGTVTVTMKVSGSTLSHLGTAPSARIRPTTALGGNYFVELDPGGLNGTFKSASIPLSRTQVPVELQTVLRALPPVTQTATQQTVRDVNQTLQAGATGELSKVLGDAPATLAPAAPVLKSVLGTRPATDLPGLVTSVDNVADVLTARAGQLANVVSLLNQTTAALAQQSQPLGTTIADLPQTLATTRAGLSDLRGTLTLLTVAAPSAEPAVKQLDPLLVALNPVLAQTKPLLDSVQPVLQQARPLVDQLVPTSQVGTSVLDDVRGPVLAKVNGPIISTIMGDWRGFGPKYPGGGNTGHTFYQTLAYMLTNMASSSSLFGQNGHLTNFSVGGGTQTLAGLPPTIQQLLGLLPISGTSGSG